MQDRIEDFSEMLAAGEDADLSETIRRGETTGRPLGDSMFLDTINEMLKRDPRLGKRGRRARWNN